MDLATWADTGVGVLLLGCGALVVWRRAQIGRGVGIMMAAAGFCWLLGGLYPAAILIHRGPLVHLHLSYPTGRLRSRLSVVAVTTGYVAALVGDAAVLTLLVAGFVGVVAVRDYRRTFGSARRAGRPAVVAAVAYAAVLCLSSANDLLSWHAGPAVLVGYEAVVAAIAITLSADLLWGRWSEATVADLVTQLGTRSDTVGLTDELRRAVGDPTLRIGFWVDERGGYVDESGRPFLVQPSGLMVSSVDDGMRPLALVVHDRALLADRLLLDGAIAALRLVVSSVQLRLSAAARVRELTAVRRRILESADEQRRELEAAITTGPGAHLADAREKVARIHAAYQSPALEALLYEIAEAELELHRFAAGVRPPALEAGGLAAALPALVASAPLPVDLVVTCERLPPTIEAAAYFVCAEALANVEKHARATRVRIIASLDAGQFHLIVSDDGVGGAAITGPGLGNLADRLDALGGRLTVSSVPGAGTVVRANFTCGAGGTS